jgi:hypothetical protein
MTIHIDFANNAVSHPSFIPPAIYSPYAEKPRQMPAGFYSTDSQNTLTGVEFSATLAQLGGRFSFLDSRSYIVERSENHKAINVISEHWKKHLYNLSAWFDVDTLSETIDGIYDAIDQFGPGAIDLSSIESKDVNGVHLAAILRATFPFQNFTQGWDHALGEAVSALQRDGVDINDALAGLQ